MPTYTYQVTGDDGLTDDMFVTTAANATNDSGNGEGYDITSIAGKFDGQDITAEYGSGGVTSSDANIGSWDNVLFTNNQQGAGSSELGIDQYVIAFTTSGGQEFAIYSNGPPEHGFSVQTLGVDYTSRAPDDRRG